VLPMMASDLAPCKQACTRNRKSPGGEPRFVQEVSTVRGLGRLPWMSVTPSSAATAAATRILPVLSRSLVSRAKAATTRAGELRAFVILQAERAALRRQHHGLGPHKSGIERDGNHAVRLKLMGHVGRHLVRGCLGNAIDQVSQVFLCRPVADVHDQAAPPRGTMILAACELATKAARTPASIMPVQRWAGCCQNGNAQVNRPSSTIRS